jgi:hypothetical protein
MYHSTNQENREIYKVFYFLIEYRTNVVFVSTSDYDDDDDDDDDQAKTSLGTS